MWCVCVVIQCLNHNSQHTYRQQAKVCVPLISGWLCLDSSVCLAATRFLILLIGFYESRRITSL